MRYIVVVEANVSGFISVVLFLSLANKLVNHKIFTNTRRLEVDSASLDKTMFWTRIGKKFS